jgi:hypothetical protein
MLDALKECGAQVMTSVESCTSCVRHHIEHNYGIPLHTRQCWSQGLIKSCTNSLHCNSMKCALKNRCFHLATALCGRKKHVWKTPQQCLACIKKVRQAIDGMSP